jgi:hypothetical protein
MAGRKSVVAAVDEGKLSGLYGSGKPAAERIARPPDRGRVKRDRAKAGLADSQNQQFGPCLRACGICRWRCSARAGGRWHRGHVCETWKKPRDEMT